MNKIIVATATIGVTTKTITTLTLPIHRTWVMAQVFLNLGTLKEHRQSRAVSFPHLSLPRHIHHIRLTLPRYLCMETINMDMDIVSMGCNKTCHII